MTYGCTSVYTYVFLSLSLFFFSFSHSFSLFFRLLLILFIHSSQSIHSSPIIHHPITHILQLNSQPCLLLHLLAVTDGVGCVSRQDMTLGIVPSRGLCATWIPALAHRLGHLSTANISTDIFTAAITTLSASANISCPSSI
eukprot:m.87446 g.87446  ORF g.87446 m.87446 type:complete len:141 (+) comp14508_c1_seq1:105-527(+)